jgi:hypothetical protein
VAIVKVDDQTLDTAFIQEYLQRPANDPVRIAAEKWQAQQEAKVRRAQAGAAPKTTRPTDKKAEGIKKSEEIVAAGRAKAETEITAKERAANEKARKAGAALPYPTTAAATTRQVGIPGAGRGTTPLPQGPGLGGRDVFPTGLTSPTKPTGPTRTATETLPTGEVTPTGGTSGGKTPAPPKTSKEKREVKSEILVSAGINQAVVQYMKENYPEDWAKIKELVDIALATDDPTKSLPRIANAFKTTTYWKNAAIEKNRTTIGTYFLNNGLDTISNAGVIDKLTNDVFVTGVITLQQAQVQIRRDAVAKLGLTGPDADPSKIKIAQAMIDSGQTFMQAANDYIGFYTEVTNTPLNEFDPFEDRSFLSIFNQSRSLTDFAQKIKSSPAYTMSTKGRQEIDSTKLRLQQLTRNLGLGYAPQQLESQAINVMSGQQTFDQIELSLRSIAGEAFPAFKDRILAGETITSIASPYVSSMSRILEMPDSSIDISDPNNQIRKALIGDGKTPKPLWQFEQELFKDNRWQYTSNALETVDSISADVLRRFGVIG